MPKPTHDEEGTPFSPVPPVLKEPTDADVTYTHSKDGTPISPYEVAQDIEQPVAWRVGDDDYTVDGNQLGDYATAAGEAYARNLHADEDDRVEVEVTESRVTHDPGGTPKSPYREGSVDDVGGDDSVVELASRIRKTRGYRDDIDSQESAERRVRSDAAYKALEDAHDDLEGDKPAKPKGGK